MNCLEFRRRKLADPADADPALLSHRDECVHCRAFESELTVLDDGIREAFAVPVPDNLPSRILLSNTLRNRAANRWRKSPKARWLAMAASFAVAAILVTAVLRPAPVTALETSIVEHLGHEEAMARARETPLTRDEIRPVLAKIGLDASELPFEVFHAMNCVIDGKLMAHLVVRDGEGQVTLVLMPFAGEASPAGFSVHGWHGRLEQRSFGSIAALAEQSGDRSQQAAIDRALSRIAPMINSAEGSS